jgi:hypothetical protein
MLTSPERIGRHKNAFPAHILQNHFPILAFVKKSRFAAGALSG